MFFEKDYILRMIQMMGDLMRRIGEMLDDGEREALLSQAAREHCGMDLNAARGLSVESLIALLTPQQLIMMAELHYIRAMMTSLPDEEREELNARAARLLLSLKDKTELCLMRRERLVSLIEGAGGLLSAGERMDAVQFLLNADDFARAEDELFEALDEASAEEYPGLLGRGEALLSQCLALPETALIAGGLPRAEVLEGLEDIKGRKAAYESRRNGVLT